MFLEERVGRIEERLGEIETVAKGPDADTQRKLSELNQADVQLRTEATQFQNRLAALEKLSLEAKLQQTQNLLRQLENRLSNAENHDNRQLGIQKQTDDRLEAVEQAVGDLPLDVIEDSVSQIEAVRSQLEQLWDNANALQTRLEGLDRLNVDERLAQLEELAGAFQSFRNESNQLFELLQGDLASQAERDDQLFELLGKLEGRVNALDLQPLEERMNEAEAAMSGFRAVVKEVRQRFDQYDQRFNDAAQRLTAADEQLAELMPLPEQVNALEEHLLSFDSNALQQRIATAEELIQGIELQPIRARLEELDAVARQLGLQIQDVPEHLQAVQQALTTVRERQTESDGCLDNHEDRLNAFEANQNQLPTRIQKLEEQLAGSDRIAESMKELADRVKELEIDNRDLRERLRTVKISSTGEASASSDWIGRSLATVAIAAALLVAWIALQPQNVLTAQRFVLKGADGNVYALLDSKDARGVLELVDGAGRPVATLGSTAEGPSLRLADSSGAHRAVVGLGSDGHPSVRLNDSRGASRVELGVDEVSHVTLRDSQGDRRAVMIAASQGPQLALLRASEQPQFVAGHGALGDGISVYDPQRRLRLGLGITADGAAVNLFDEKEHRRVVVSANQAGPALAFMGENSEHRTTIGVSGSGESVLNLHDGSGAQRIVFHVSENEAKFNVLDADKNVVFATP